MNTLGNLELVIFDSMGGKSPSSIHIDRGISSSHLFYSWILGFYAVQPWRNGLCRVIYSKESDGKRPKDLITKPIF